MERVLLQIAILVFTASLVILLKNPFYLYFLFGLVFTKRRTVNKTVEEHFNSIDHKLGQILLLLHKK